MRYGMLIDLTICAGCGACVMACKQKNATPKGIYWCNIYFGEEGEYPNCKKRVLPYACNQCKNPSCVAACPTGASQQNENGIVTIDNEVCIGCRKCVDACPYEVRHYIMNDPYGDPYWGEGYDLTPYEEARTTVLHKVGTVGKCNFCIDRLEQGKDPMCVHTCITKCRVFGDLDDPNSEISKAIAEGNAKPYLADRGTEPCLYYIGDIGVFEIEPEEETRTQVFEAS